MKKRSLVIALGFGLVLFESCKKNECHECHYDVNGTEVEIGEKCGDDLEAIEKDGIVVNGVQYTVHCHEH